MADILLSTLVGGGGLTRLAPDLTWPSSKQSATVTYERITGINAQGSLTTALLLTGKFSISYLFISGWTAEAVTIKLTIDGEVIWNDSFSATLTSENLLGQLSSAGLGPQEVISCDSSLLLEIQTATDTSITLDHTTRPIL